MNSSPVHVWYYEDKRLAVHDKLDQTSPPTVNWSLVKLLRDRSRGEKATKTLTVPTCQSRQTVSLTVNRDSNSLNLFFFLIKSAKGL